VVLIGVLALTRTSTAPSLSGAKPRSAFITRAKWDKQRRAFARSPAREARTDDVEVEAPVTSTRRGPPDCASNRMGGPR
jgi:hypothetical protein